jgi:hypothetical protein
MFDYDGLNELWNIILCVTDDQLADRATCFLLHLYYTKQSMMIRRSNMSMCHKYFLQAVYTRLSGLLRTSVSSTNETDEFYRTLKLCGEQLTTKSCVSSFDKLDYQSWLHKIERLLMIIDEYIHLVEREQSLIAHVTLFHGIEYQIKIILGHVNKSHNFYDRAIVHSNDTLEMLRTSLAQFYHVSSNEIQLSMQSTRPLRLSGYDHIKNDSTNELSSSSSSTTGYILDSYFNSRYLYELDITAGTIVYVKLLVGTSHQSATPVRQEPGRIYLTRSTRVVSSHHTTYNVLSMPSTMISQDFKFYDILYKLSFVNNEAIHRRIRSLLYSMPSDRRLHDCLEQISLPRGNMASSRSSASSNKLNQCIERMFDVKMHSAIQLIYHIEILSSKILPQSADNGMRQSSRLFRQDFIEQDGIEFLFRLLHDFSHSISNDDQYALRQEMIILILQLLEMFLFGRMSTNDVLSLSTAISTEPVALSSYSEINETNVTNMEWNQTAIVNDLSNDDFVRRIEQLILLSWSAAVGNRQLQEQVMNSCSRNCSRSMFSIQANHRKSSFEYEHITTEKSTIRMLPDKYIDITIE